MDNAHEDFKLEWHGNTVVITPANNVESMRWDLIEQAADIVMEPLRQQEVPMVVVDLSSSNRPRGTVRKRSRRRPSATGLSSAFHTSVVARFNVATAAPPGV